MTNVRQAAMQALEALESSRIFVITREKTKHPEGTEWYDSAITALKAALEQPEQEPVAWQYKTAEAGIFVSDQHPPDVEVWNDIEWSKPLYTTPPQRPWVGLTNEDVNRESAPITSQMKLAFHAGMYVAQKILKERNT
jgi:hypothetical protein